MKLLSFLFISLLPSAQGHTRLECPPPRSGETGEKVGPCDAPDDPSLPAYPLVPGALNTITWLESIPHPGAPARFALSLEGDDSVASFESCLLLDHVPHDAYSLPNFANEATWHRSSITLWIPDVFCERCHLQLMTVMSDEVHGVPVNTTCAYGGALAQNKTNDSSLPACPVVYHSCAPVSINGTVPRNNITECNTTEFEDQLDWPMRPQPDNGGVYDHSTYYYKGDPGMYNRTTSRLMAVGAPLTVCDDFAFCDPLQYFDMTLEVPEDALYIAMEGTCAAMVTLQVEPFAVGVLPSTPKNMSVPPLATPPPAPTGVCAPCAPLAQCFAEGCFLRNPVTGNWTGDAAPCNDFAPPCEPCFPDSPCFRGEASATDSESDSESDAVSDTASESEATSAPAVMEEEDDDLDSGSNRMAWNIMLLGAAVLDSSLMMVW